MANIVRGTTPTIRYTFSTIDVADISVAKLVIKQYGSNKIEKELEDSTTGENYIDWKLSQSETLGLTEGATAVIGLDWLLSDGTRGIGNSVGAMVTSSSINEVIDE